MKAVFVVLLVAVTVCGCESSSAAAAEKPVKPLAPELQGLSPAQREVALTALGGGVADCGGAGCQGACKGEACPVRTVRLQRVAALAKAGRSAAEIQAELGPCGCGAEKAGAAPEAGAVYRVPIGSSPVAGPADARVTLVEFTDYECPFCARANATVDELVRQYGGKLRVVVKHNPLPFHANANGAALAALAAGEQGRYWEMHQRLFAAPPALDAASLERHARELGLNVEAWKAAMRSPKLQQQVDADKALAQTLGAQGTPTFFVNGRKLVGAQPLEAFKGVIDAELARAEALLKGGVRSDELYARIIERGLTAEPAQREEESASAAPKPVTVPANAPQRGPRTAKVTVVVFSDFECPFCGRGGQVLKQLEATYGDRVRIVFRNMPLPMHASARPAAAAALAAHEQGKFWEFHDLLFAHQNALGREALEGYARQLGLDLPRFRSALDSGRFNADLDADVAEASRLGVTGTPTFFINGRMVVGAQPFEVFKGKVEEALNAP